MPNYGVDRILYFCPKLNRRVLLSLDYSTLLNDKIYTSIECESKSKCDEISETHMYRNNNVCTAYKLYIESF